jgi:hypothetical protein
MAWPPRPRIVPAFWIWTSPKLVASMPPPLAPEIVPSLAMRAVVPAPLPARRSASPSCTSAAVAPKTTLPPVMDPAF